MYLFEFYVCLKCDNNDGLGCSLKSFEMPLGDNSIFQPCIGERTRRGAASVRDVELDSQFAKKKSSGKKSSGKKSSGKKSSGSSLVKKKSSGDLIGSSSGKSARQLALHNKLSTLDFKQEQTPAAPAAAGELCPSGVLNYTGGWHKNLYISTVE